MKYCSLGNRSKHVTFREALLKGIAEDGTLFVPESIPRLDNEKLESFTGLSFSEIAGIILEKFLDDDFNHREIELLVKEAFNFDCKLVNIQPDVWALELFHGPTLAFKDFGARLLAQVLGRLTDSHYRNITILVATSGDTGSAVAHAFYSISGIQVVILYPSGKVSVLQEKQMASLGGNIHALRIDGNFDDCQRLVKEAFSDPELREELFLTSANSINVARWIAQTVYYAYAWSRLPERKQVIFSVPSGNFGNLSAGVLAKKMGIPVSAFAASTNVNDVVPAYLRSRVYLPRPSQSTISNAMDVGNPNNFPRLLHLYENDWNKISGEVKGFSFSDEATRQAIKTLYTDYGYLADPHSAIGWLGLRHLLYNNPGSTGVFLATAHPAKFTEVVEPVIGSSIPLPYQLEILKSKPVVSKLLSPHYNELKAFLLAC
ncbi:MAG: threonine synthase [Cyclobacteriaceae bacterium]|nr:threonine synthase [Cyclobacteriaceae bacterium]